MQNAPPVGQATVRLQRHDGIARIRITTCADVADGAMVEHVCTGADDALALVRDFMFDWLDDGP